MPFDGFSKAERSYLAGQRLGRLATASPSGIVGNAPVAFFVRSDDTIDICGRRMGATKKFRNVTAGSRWHWWSTTWHPDPAGIPATWRSGARRRRCPTWSRPRAGSPVT